VPRWANAEQLYLGLRDQAGLNLSAAARSKAPFVAFESSKRDAKRFQPAMIDTWKALADVELLQDLCGAIESITNDSQRSSTLPSKLGSDKIANNAKNNTLK